MIKKILALTLSIMLISGIAMASQTSYYFDGKVSQGITHFLKAPYTGTVSKIYADTNMAIAKGEKVMELEPQTCYSPVDGVVGASLAKPGDNLSIIKEVYKASIFIDTVDQSIAKCSHNYASQGYEYSIAHLGETVYLQGKGDRTQTGVGEIISRDEKNYIVRIREGNIRYGERVFVYRDPNFDGKKRLGIGKTSRTNPVAVNAEGVMIDLLVKPGDTVKSGDPLFTYTSSSYNGEGSTIVMPDDGIITKIEKKLSEKVDIESVLASYIVNDEKFIIAKVSEVEANSFKVGHKLYANAQSANIDDIECEIIAISAIPDDKGMYDMHLKAKGIENLRIGTTLSFYEK